MIQWGHVDNLVMMKNPTRYNQNWFDRCNDCLAPCCLHMTMGGYVGGTYAYQTQEEVSKEVHKAKVQFNDNFVICEPFPGIRICPLVVDTHCLIYEDRPTLCKMFKCHMKCVLS